MRSSTKSRSRYGPSVAGYVEAPTWDFGLREGKREGLISFETFQKIQERVNGNARARVRKDLSEDFPLRGSVVCGHCGTPLTAGWSSGRTARYPYYLCPKRGCESYGKSIRRNTIEGEFETLHETLRPTEALFQVACAMFKQLSNHRLENGRALQGFSGLLRGQKQIGAPRRRNFERIIRGSRRLECVSAAPGIR